MTCKGIRPDGTHCTCPDEFTVQGLCASCAAPESTGLVPIGSTELMAHPALDALYRELPPKAQAFPAAYTKTRTIKGGAEACGISRQSHYDWLKNAPGYDELFEVAERDVLDQWRHIYVERTEHGVTERTYDAEGNLKQTCLR